MIRLSVPLVAPSMNKLFGRGHWSQRSEVVKAWNYAVWILCKQDKIPPVTGYPVCITTKSYFKGKCQRDTSNCFPANKLVEDGLVEAGILKDDTPQYVCRHIIEVPEFGCPEDMTVVTISKGELK